MEDIRNCNVKHELKKLTLSLTKDSANQFDFKNLGQRISCKEKAKRNERKAWTALLTYLNSPYVVSSNNFYETENEEDNEFKIYNDLMSKAFLLKVYGRTMEGLRIEKLAETVKSLQVNPMLLRLLLSLSWMDDCITEQDNFHNIYNFYSFNNGSENQSESSLLSWVDFGKNGIDDRERMFFQVDFLAEALPTTKNIFSDIPARQFMKCTSSFDEEMVDNSVTKKVKLFGALTNQKPDESTNSLDMVLSLPEIPTDTSSIIFRPKSKSISIDEGFIDDSASSSSNDVIESRSDVNDHLQIWTDCLNSTRLVYTWERLLRHHEDEATTYLTESGPNGIDHLLNLRHEETIYITEQKRGLYFAAKDELIKHAVNVLIGLPSKSFHFKKTKCSFAVETTLRMSGLSPEALQGILMRFAEIGTHYRQLNRFTQHHSEKLSGLSGGLTLEAFVTSLRKYIDSYKHAVLQIQDGVTRNFLQLRAIFEDMGQQMKFLADVCLCSAAFGRNENAPRPKFPMGLKLMSYLYDLCIENKSTIHYSVLLHFYKDTSLPFLRKSNSDMFDSLRELSSNAMYITNWIFDGVCRDPYHEFLLHVDDQYLCYRDKHYWTHGYVLKANRKEIGMFDAEFIEQIYACGKAINLLKLTNQRHYLLQGDLQRPSIGILLSTIELDKVHENSEKYIAEVNQAREEDLQSKQLRMQEILQKRREEVEKERAEIEQKIKRLNDMEQQIRKTVHEKKFKELQRLKKQMEDDFEEKKVAREMRLKEDKEYMRNLDKMSSEKDEQARKAREQLLAYYEELTNKAVTRENRALWNVRRLELYRKRKEFIMQEEMLLQQENANFIASRKSVDDQSLHAHPQQSLNNFEKASDLVSLPVSPGIFGDEKSQAKEKPVESLQQDFMEIPVDKESGEITASLPKNGTDSGGIEVEHLGENVEEEFPREKKYGKEGVEAKDLLYGDGGMEFVKEISNEEIAKLWEIERSAAIQPTSEMKGLLYPGGLEKNVAMEPMKSTRGHEPVARIKELLYHYNDKGENEDETLAASFTEEELFGDFDVEPFQDDFKSMDLPPQPGIFDSLIKGLGKSETYEVSADVIDHLSLEMIIDRSIIAPVYAQINLVQSAAVEYFMDTLQIGLHFDVFRRFLLLEDGEFGLSLCNDIFEKAFTSVSAKEFCQPAILNSTINKALQFSLFADKVELSRQLTFSLKWLPEAIRTVDITSLDFLQLRYKVPWPCNIVITENCIIKYNKVFSFLLQLKRVNWALQRVWKILKRAGHNHRAAASSQLRQLQLFRHEMQHFVNNVERYLVNQIIHISWQEFQNDLKNNVHNVDDLHKSHVNYLNRIIFRSLLSKNAAPVLKIISDIFSLILKFDFQLLSSQWKENQDGCVTHSNFTLMCSTHKAYKEYTAFLFKVVSKLIRRGYQHHLDDFLLQVNFNGFYEHAVS